MAVALETVVKQLEDSGIVAPGKLENFVPPKAHPTSAEELVRELVKQNHLTKFQATQVAAGKSKSLILGAYTILDRIGAGGMGQVFKALHRRMDRTVAIKMLPNAVSKDPAAMARFEREVRAAAKLHHTNIVTAFDADQASGVHFLVMEYVEGSDLSALVKKNGPLSIAKAVNYTLQAARGLEFAHAEGVIHRDIKPANLLLDKKGVVKILDMGLARIDVGADAATQAELTGTGAVMGTVDYMAPEQALSTKHADARADIYSLGCTLFYLLTGKPTYDGETITAKLIAHQAQPIPALRTVCKEASPELEAVFNKMMAKRAEERYQSMSAVVADLEQLNVGPLSASGTQSSAGAKSDSALTLLQGLPDLPTVQTSKKTTRKTTKKVATAQAGDGTQAVWKNAKVLAGGGVLGVVILAGIVFSLMKKPEAPEVGVKQSDAEVPGANQAKMAWNTPAFQQWVKETQALPAEGQVVAVVKKLQELNPGHDGKHRSTIEGNDVTLFSVSHVADISPVRALRHLRELTISGATGGAKGPKTTVADISPLQGMKLKRLSLRYNPFKDLSPVRGMPLDVLDLQGTQVSDLTPLRGMPLTSINVGGSVTDLTPLEDCKSLTFVTGVVIPPFTTAQVAALQQALPQCKINARDTSLATTPITASPPITDFNAPAFQQWVKETQALPADQQVAEVSKKLVELNPGFDGKFEPKIDGGAVVGVNFVTDNDVTDLSPIRVFSKLQTLSCAASKKGVGRLTDLSPLRGLPLVSLDCGNSLVSDLSPLAGMKLTTLACFGSNVADLSPLRGMPLRFLDASNTDVSNLKPLAGMPLETLWLTTCPQLSDLTPLEGLKLKAFSCNFTVVSSLAPLRGMPLEKIHVYGTKITDLTPLQGMPLSDLNCGATKVKEIKPLATLPLKVLTLALTEITDFTPLEKCQTLELLQVFKTPITATGVAELQAALPKCKIEWQDPNDPAPVTKPITDINSPAFQQWVKDTQTLPVEEQIKAVSKKLVELNPGFDGKITPVIEEGTVTGLQFLSDQITDLSPLWALSKLNHLNCMASSPTAGRLADLSPLRGLPLKFLDCGYSQLRDLSPLAGMKLASLTCFSSQVTDLSPLEGMPLELLNVSYNAVTDLKPLKGMPLKSLSMQDCKLIADLAPLQGMQLEELECDYTAITTLAPLEGMPLRKLMIHGTQISDLSMLHDMPLEILNCGSTKVTDISPLQSLPLNHLSLGYAPITDFSPLKKCVSLETLQVVHTSITPAGVAELQKALPKCKIEWQDPNDPSAAARPLTDINSPAFQQWVKSVQAMSAEKQVAEVSKKLVELNPGFDGKVEPTVEEGVVKGISFFSESVTDISPVGALKGLTKLTCSARDGTVSQLSDLSPLRGLSLKSIEFKSTAVADLSPLKGMSLEILHCGYSKVSDFSPVAGMPLTVLICGSEMLEDLSPVQKAPIETLVIGGSRVSDLTSLKDMPLKTLQLAYVGHVSNLSPLAGKKLESLSILASPVTDLSPLQGMPLTTLHIRESNVSDLSPLKGMKLKDFVFSSSQVTEFSVLKDMPLTNVSIDFQPARDTQLLRSIKSLQSINNKPVAEFWKDVEAKQAAFQQWMKDVQALPAEKQAAEVKKKLMEFNPGFDGDTPTLVVEGGAVTQIGFYVMHVTDISPVRALTKLKVLYCNKGILSDLSPLRGMKLTTLFVNETNVHDLSPLRGMPLDRLNVSKTGVKDLSPIVDMPLTWLEIDRTPVKDISPLKGKHTLAHLNCYETDVADLSPLQGLKLTFLGCNLTKVTDWSVLQGMPLGSLWGDFKLKRDGELLRSIKSLIEINGQPVANFWKVFEANSEPAEKK